MTALILRSPTGSAAWSIIREVATVETAPPQTAMRPMKPEVAIKPAADRCRGHTTASEKTIKASSTTRVSAIGSVLDMKPKL
jgi:hypothetical protein